jgi:hypothetical protein
MALFSDIDWAILLAVAGFLLFGKDNAQVLRTLGRWYGRAGRLKQEILTEITKAADLPPPAPGQPFSLRGALLGLDSPMPARRGIPAAVRLPPAAPPAPSLDTPAPWTGGAPAPVWSTTQVPVTGSTEVRP